MTDVRRNMLGEEVSPYLLQHQDNPVWWYAWSEEAFQVAKQLNRPVFLSIGYSTCYWCHVMEKESFEDPSVAEILNDGFVSIKVDREERPDVDAIYMDAVVGLTGHGGWPMSVLLTPEKKPFWAGTYIPKPQFTLLLREVKERWVKDRTAIVVSSEEITNALSQRELSRFSGEEGEPSDWLKLVSEEALSRFDATHGGFGRAPKFPPSTLLDVLLRVFFRSRSAPVLNAITVTLDAMAAGGIYDHIGGGFARYSTDDEWRVPHFEKMLYDNALLASTYFRASVLLNKEEYREVGEEILRYLERDMKAPSSGAFFAAEDAGEVGKEGEFYLWTFDELKAALSNDELGELRERFEVSERGNFEGKIVFHLKNRNEWQERFTGEVREKLFRLRDLRARPHRDEKLLTAWNALLLSSFVEGSLTTDKDQYKQSAESIGTYLVEEVFQTTLCTSIASGVRKGEGGCLDDYAYTVQALVQLFELTGKVHWLFAARDIQTVQDSLLWLEDKGAYRFSSDASLIVEKVPIFDGPIPNGNAVSMSNLVKLSSYFLAENFRAKAVALGEIFSPLLSKVPSAVPSAILAALHWKEGKELIISGVDGQRREVLHDLRIYLPLLTLCCILDENENYQEVPLLADKQREHPHYFFCEAGRCLAPIHDRSELVSIMHRVYGGTE